VPSVKTDLKRVKDTRIEQYRGGKKEGRNVRRFCEKKSSISGELKKGEGGEGSGEKELLSGKAGKQRGGTGSASCDLKVLNLKKKSGVQRRRGRGKGKARRVRRLTKGANAVKKREKKERGCGQEAERTTTQGEWRQGVIRARVDSYKMRYSD